MKQNRRLSGFPKKYLWITINPGLISQDELYRVNIKNHLRVAEILISL